MLVLTSTIEKGINVRKELAIFEMAGEQYKTIHTANYNATRNHQEKPYTDEYKDNALSAHVEAELLLEEFLECINGIDELKEKLAREKQYFDNAVEYGYDDDEFWTKGYRQLKPFVDSLLEQAYLAPIVELALKNR